MSIASEITRINTNIAAAYTACDGKGATMPQTQNSANLADTIGSISVGGGIPIDPDSLTPCEFGIDSGGVFVSSVSGEGNDIYFGRDGTGIYVKGGTL